MSFLDIFLIKKKMNKSIIILSKDNVFEAWGSITEVCKAHKYSYSYLKGKKFPFTYKGVRFEKVPFRERNGI